MKIARLAHSPRGDFGALSKIARGVIVQARKDAQGMTDVSGPAHEDAIATGREFVFNQKHEGDFRGWCGMANVDYKWAREQIRKALRSGKYNPRARKWLMRD